MKAKAMYHNVSTRPSILCPECNCHMMYSEISDVISVFCNIAECPNYLVEYRVTEHPTVTLIACGNMCYRPHDGAFVHDAFIKHHW